MASNDYEDFILETQNSHNVPAESVTLKSDAAEGVEEAAAVPGGKLCRLVVVGFCLLCVLQATLNISLRFILSSQQNTLITERDELKEKLKDYDLQRWAVIEERDNLTTLLKNLGWTLFGNSVYYVSSTTKTWQESRNYCNQSGADLIIINSEEEQNFAKQFKKRVWIGLTDSVDEGTWKWVDGTQLNTSHWIDKEPNGNRIENCGELKSFEKEKSWNDEPCSHSLQWICEKKLI